MTLTRRDAASTVLAALVVLAYLSNSHDWGVPLLTSNRWAAGAILVLAIGMWTLEREPEDVTSPLVILLSVLGVAALALVALALWTEEQWALGILAIVTLVLYALSTLRHATLATRTPVHPA